MSADSGVDRAAFEVYCAHCRVSFPVETRVCLHCGGPTGHAAYGASLANGYSTAATKRPIEPMADSPVSYGKTDVEAPLPAEDAPASLGRSLIRSLGGIIWVLLLIGYSLAQSCGE